MQTSQSACQRLTLLISQASEIDRDQQPANFESSAVIYTTMCSILARRMEPFLFLAANRVHRRMLLPMCIIQCTQRINPMCTLSLHYLLLHFLQMIGWRPAHCLELVEATEGPRFARSVSSDQNSLHCSERNVTSPRSRDRHQTPFLASMFSSFLGYCSSDSSVRSLRCMGGLRETYTAWRSSSQYRSMPAVPCILCCSFVGFPYCTRHTRTIAMDPALSLNLKLSPID